MDPARTLLATAVAFCSLCLVPSGAEVSTVGDDNALVQISSAAHEAMLVGKAVVESPGQGPLVRTQDGPIRGVTEDGCHIFKKIPYAESPVRFEKSVPKKPWAPETLDGTKYGPGCIGSHTGVPESEDCLNLNIWVPLGGHTNMPVIVYFHGGMNQHGSGQEALRQGDGITHSKEYPVIFINFDFRMGIFGWYERAQDGIPSNLGLYDQQQALRWVNRNIAAFGGDPNQVALEGQSEGAGIILVHMVSPGSAGLFHRAIFHSPPADMWSRKVNRQRTEFMIRRLGCHKKTSVVPCLRSLNAQRLWSADWVSEELSRNPGSVRWFQNAFGLLSFAKTTKTAELPGLLGWHAVVDGSNVPGEPRELISQGRWNKVPVLLTVSKNESLGIFPGVTGAEGSMKLAMTSLSRVGDYDRVLTEYKQTLAKSGIVVKNPNDLLHQMVTDKMWTCDIRSLAGDIMKGGGTAFVGMFWHSPKYDPVGTMTNKVCGHGATCHAAEMLYALPQGRGRGIHGDHMESEIAFAEKYMREVLMFVHGRPTVWVPYNLVTEPMTFYDTTGTRVVERYRKEQCDVLDSSMGEIVPSFMRERVLARGF